MGYRSNVAYAIRFKDKEHLQGFLAAVRMTELDDQEAKKAFDDLLEYSEYNKESGNWLTFETEDIKWYDTFLYVQAHHRFLELSEDFDGSWEFIRLGENDDDVERQTGGNDPPYALRVSRQIEWDLDLA